MLSVCTNSYSTQASVTTTTARSFTEEDAFCLDRAKPRESPEAGDCFL